MVGLTVRYDRIDNFWFCLLHELAHIGRHMENDGDASFVDDLTLRDIEGGRRDATEAQADEWAEEALVPRAIWETSEARRNPTPMTCSILRMHCKLIQPLSPERSGATTTIITSEPSKKDPAVAVVPVGAALH